MATSAATLMEFAVSTFRLKLSTGELKPSFDECLLNAFQVHEPNWFPAPAADDTTVKFLTDTDWAKAKKHFDQVVGHYEALRGMPGVNVTVALTYVFVPLLERYNAGERSAALYQEMMDVE